MYNDEYFMEKALELAEEAKKENEIPVGAVIVKDNVIIARACNKKVSEHVVTRHAELIAIEKASKTLNDWRLNDCKIYITMEPCPMCASAIQQARFAEIIYGCSSNMKTNTEIIKSILNNNEFNHQVNIKGPILNERCSKIIKNFFKKKRQ
jgi:tRNA(adenine34) deaminase